MKVQEYKKFTDLPKNIVSNEQSLPIFITSAYAKMLTTTKGFVVSWFVGFDEDRILFILPFGIKKILFFKKGMCLFSSYCFDLEHYSIEKEKLFINNFLFNVTQLKCCDWIQQAPNHALFSVVPDHSLFCPFGTFRVDISGNKEEILQQIRRDERRSIRKVEKDGGVIVFGKKYLDDAFNVIMSTLTKAELSTFSEERVLAEQRILKDHFIVGVCYHNSIPQSAVIAYKTHHSVYAIYAGSIYKSLRGATNRLYYDIYLQGAKEGANYFDFVGALQNVNKDSKLYRIQQFKRHMGGKFNEGFVWKFIFNNPKYILYNNLLKLYNAFKGKKFKGDIIDRQIKRLHK